MTKAILKFIANQTKTKTNSIIKWRLIVMWNRYLRQSEAISKWITRKEMISSKWSRVRAWPLKRRPNILRLTILRLNISLSSTNWWTTGIWPTTTNIQIKMFNLRRRGFNHWIIRIYPNNQHQNCNQYLPNKVQICKLWTTIKTTLTLKTKPNLSQWLFKTMANKCTAATTSSVLYVRTFRAYKPSSKNSKRLSRF